MKKILASLLCLSLLLSASCALAADINFVTAGTASTFYPISATVCQLWNDNIEGMRAVATPSGGGIDNLNQAYDGEAQIGIANANLVYQAQEGIASFEGYANDKLRIFAGLYINPNQVVVTKASGIESLEDLIGKKISIGAAGSTTVDEAAVHLGSIGKTLDDIKAEYMDTSAAMSTRPAISVVSVGFTKSRPPASSIARQITRSAVAALLYLASGRPARPAASASTPTDEVANARRVSESATPSVLP